jgi:hypothetical protein
MTRGTRSIAYQASGACLSPAPDPNQQGIPCGSAHFSLGQRPGLPRSERTASATGAGTFRRTAARTTRDDSLPLIGATLSCTQPMALSSPLPEIDAPCGTSPNFTEPARIQRPRSAALGFDPPLVLSARLRVASRTMQFDRQRAQDAKGRLCDAKIRPINLLMHNFDPSGCSAGTAK